MKYFRILIVLVVVLLTSCNGNDYAVLFDDKAVVFGVGVNCRRHNDAKHKKYEAILRMSNSNTFNGGFISFLTDSLYSVGDTVYFSKHY